MSRNHKGKPNQILSSKWKEGERKIPGRSWYLDKILLGVGLVIVLTFLFPYEETSPIINLREGDVAQKDIIAPFRFSLYKSPEELRQQQEEAAQAVLPIVEQQPEVKIEAETQLDQFLALIDSLRTTDWPESTKIAHVLEMDLGISSESIDLCLTTQDWQDLKASVLYLFQDRLSMGGITDQEKALLAESADRSIRLQEGDQEQIVLLQDIISLSQARQEILQTLGNIYPTQENLLKAAYEIIKAFLQPTLVFNQAKTEQLRQESIASVALTKGEVFKDEVIIRSHSRVTAEHVDKLRSLERALRARRVDQSPWKEALYPFLGRFLLVALSIALLVAYIKAYTPGLLDDFRLLLLLWIVLACQAGVSFLMTTSLDLSVYLIPTAVAPILTTVLINAHLGIGVAVVTGILAGGITSFNYEVMLAALVGGVTAVYSVRKVRRRNDYYRSMIYIPLAYALTIVTFDLLRLTPTKQLLGNTGWGVLNGILSPIFTIGLIPIFESLFKVTTDLTLLELSDLNRPILKRMAMEAPGTLQHSITIGTLAQAAAERIGANALLAMVGAYYHDIGKIRKPKYFGENLEAGEENPHDKLTPNMSNLILEHHVTTDGLEMAQQEKLPQIIIDFIRQHHGRTLKVFFYRKACELYGLENVREEEYRYPGPKPQIKEVAIVSLADCTESVSRTLDEPTPDRIRTVVEEVIEERLKKGELDECNLTLRELHQIKESFITILLGVFHSRIKYPKVPEQRERREPGSKPRAVPARAET